MSNTVQAVDLLTRAEDLIERYEEVEMEGKSKKEPVITEMLVVLKELQDLQGMTGSEVFIDKLTYVTRYINNALFIEGKVTSVI